MDAPYERNPFYVLELTAGATPAEVERAGQKLLAMLGVGIEAAERHPVPGGERARDDSDVRWAMAELRDPLRRARWELYYTDPATPLPRDEGGVDPFVALGWRD